MNYYCKLMFQEHFCRFAMPQGLEACKMLCTTPGLDEMTVELLVEEWREILYDARFGGVTVDAPAIVGESSRVGIPLAR